MPGCEGSCDERRTREKPARARGGACWYQSTLTARGLWRGCAAFGLFSAALGWRRLRGTYLRGGSILCGDTMSGSDPLRRLLLPAAVLALRPATAVATFPLEQGQQPPLAESSSSCRIPGVRISRTPSRLPCRGRRAAPRRQVRPSTQTEPTPFCLRRAVLLGTRLRRFPATPSTARLPSPVPRFDFAASLETPFAALRSSSIGCSCYVTMNDGMLRNDAAAGKGVLRNKPAVDAGQPGGAY